MRETASKVREQFSLTFLFFFLFALNSFQSSINGRNNFTFDKSMEKYISKDSISSLTITIKDNRRTEVDLIKYYSDGLDRDFENIKTDIPVSDYVNNSFKLDKSMQVKFQTRKITLIIDRFRFYNINDLFHSARIFDCSIRCFEEINDATRGINIRIRDTIAVKNAEDISFTDQINRTLVKVAEEFYTKIDSNSHLLTFNVKQHQTKHTDNSK